MEEKKESPPINHFKLWLFVITVTMIFLCGRLTAHASDVLPSATTDPVTEILESAGKVYNFNYYITQSSSGVYMIYAFTDSPNVSDKGLYYDYQVTVNTKNETLENAFDRIEKILADIKNGTHTGGSGYFDFKKYEDVHSPVYANVDIPNVDGSIFFQHTPIRWGLTVAQGIPATVIQTMRIILPTAVFCLASLMVLVVLRKKLPVFLH